MPTSTLFCLLLKMLLFTDTIWPRGSIFWDAQYSKDEEVISCPLLLSDICLANELQWLYMVLPSLDLIFLKWGLWWLKWSFVVRDLQFWIVLAWLFCWDGEPYFSGISSFLLLPFRRLHQLNQGWNGFVLHFTGRHMLMFGRSSILFRPGWLLQFRMSFEIMFPL